MSELTTLSLTEAAERLGLPGGKTGRAGSAVLWRMVRSGDLKAVRIGRRYRVPVAELERLATGERRSA